MTLANHDRTALGRREHHIAKAASDLLSKIADHAPEEALSILDSRREGLMEEQVEARLEQYGPNEVTHERPPAWYEQLFHAFLTPFNGVLFAVSVVSLFSDVISRHQRTVHFARSSCFPRWCC